METFPPELVVVPFDEGKTDGDSTFNTAVVFPYTEGMTLKDLQNTVLDYFAKEWGYNGEDARTIMEEEEGIKVTGGWVVDKLTHTLINDVMIDCGSDSACYAVNRLQKTQIQNASRFTIGAE